MKTGYQQTIAMVIRLSIADVPIDKTSKLLYNIISQREIPF